MSDIVKSKLCRAKEAYKVTPFCFSTFLQHVYAGRIPSYKFAGGRWFKKEEVIAAIEKHRIATIDEVVR
jgi:hypothetical protein